MIKQALKIIGWSALAIFLFGIVLGILFADESSESNSSVPVESNSQADQEPIAEIACLNVADSLLADIESGVQDIEPGNAIGKSAAVKAPERDNAWFIAAEISGPGLEPGETIGVWITNRGADDSLDGLLFSADAYAETFSSWGSLSGTNDVSSNEPGPKEARACLSR